MQNISNNWHLIIALNIFFSILLVLAKFISLFPELRGTLWTLDEDGEVSGTVELMLGSLMMRGGFGSDFFQNCNQITSTRQTQQTEKDSPERPAQPQGSPPSEENREGEEPCDTS